MSRPEGRTRNQLRSTTIEPDAVPFAEGSCLITVGRTRVLCAATVEEGVPPFREGRGGWLTAEYAMLPRATHERTGRERRGPRGRTQEIQRLIGRSLRAAVDLDVLGEHTITVDCDVLTADGGTRTASITGACVAVAQATRGLFGAGVVEQDPLRELVAAVSVGMLEGEARLDLEYVEDVAADVDFNVVALEGERLVEVQGTAEGVAFTRPELDDLMDLALGGIEALFEMQRAVIAEL